MFRILYYTTTDGEYLSVCQAVDSLEKQYKGFFHIDFFGKNSLRSLKEMEELLDEADFVLMTLMGSHGGMDDFDGFIQKIKDKEIPLHIQSSVMKGSQSLRDKAALGENFHRIIETFIVAGGSRNYERLFLYLSNVLKGTSFEEEDVQPVPIESLYYRGELFDSIESFYEKYPKKPIQIVALFYRSQYISGNTAPVDALIEEGEKQGVRIIGCFFYSVTPTDIDSRDFYDAFRDFFIREDRPEVDALINLAGFSINTGNSRMEKDSILRLKEIDLSIIKVFTSTGSYENWKNSAQGLTQIDYSMSMVMPEFDGQIMGHLVSHKEMENLPMQTLPSHQPFFPGVQAAVETASSYAKLRLKPPAEKRIAIILHNYPAGDANIGSASGLDTFASLHKLLKRLEHEGYTLERSYETGENILEDILRHGTNERHWVDQNKKREHSLFLTSENLQEALHSLEKEERIRLKEEWGDLPGDILQENGMLLIPGFANGNIFLGMQPARGFSDDPDKITHSPDLPPHYQYLGYYHYLKNIWKADAYIHVGTHGTLEFLPGKSTGLGPHCFPFKLLDNVPNFYFYIIKNPGEGTIAKRRTDASIISYLIARLSFVDDYGELEALETKIRRYEQADYEKTEDVATYFEDVIATVAEMNLQEDLDLSLEEDPDDIIEKLWKYLYEIRGNYITKGLHTLGELPKGEDLIEMILVLMRVENGDTPSLIESFASAKGIDVIKAKEEPHSICEDGKRMGEKLLEIHEEIRHFLSRLQKENWSEEAAEQILTELALSTPDMRRSLQYLLGTLLPNLFECQKEIDSLIDGLSGRYILPGKSGNISRGGADILPSGRNFYTLDPMTVPGKSAWKTGRALADEMLRNFVEQKGEYPKSVAIVLWGLSTIRSRGDDLAEIYCLLGLEPVWDPTTERVTDLRVIPLKELGRPRIDVTVKISGVFRDMFPHQIDMLEKAFSLVAELEEDDSDNYLRSHVKSDIEEALLSGEEPTTAKEEALHRVFGCKPGAYGAGVSHAIDESSWQTQEDLASLYLDWGGYVYTSSKQGVFSRKSFEKRLEKVEATVQNATSRETDILHVDDYYQYHGGLGVAVKYVRGEKPVMYCGDSSDPQQIIIREADKELKYVYRSRVLNTEWIDSMKEHGYKAAGDLSKMFTYALGWDATADIMDDWMYEELAKKYLFDADTRKFLEENNPLALKSMIETLLEAYQRQMWQASEDMIASLYDLLLQAEGHIENTLI